MQGASSVLGMLAALSFAAGRASAGQPGGAGYDTIPKARRLAHQNGHDCLLLPICLRVVTGGSTNDDGYLQVSADSGSGYVSLADGRYARNKCVWRAPLPSCPASPHR